MVSLPLGWTVALDVAVWAVVGVVVGYAMHRVPLRHLDHDTWLTRIRPFEDHGHLYERVAIRRWKDRTPELGELFAGGVSKRSSGGRSRLERFAAETRRAELTHWLVMAAAPLFFLWNPWWLGVVMVVYAVVANLPCLVIQRYNRARIARMAERPARRRTPPGDGDDRPTGT